MKSIRIRGFFNPTRQNTTQINNQVGRLILAYDRQPNSALPLSTDLIQGRDSTGATTLDAFQQPNLDNRERFLILRDVEVYLPPLGATGSNAGATYDISVDPNDAGNRMYLDWYVNLKGLKTQWTGDTSGIASISSGALLLFAYSTGDTNATPAWAFGGSSRLRYVD